MHLRLKMDKEKYEKPPDEPFMHHSGHVLAQVKSIEVDSYSAGVQVRVRMENQENPLYCRSGIKQKITDHR